MDLLLHIQIQLQRCNTDILSVKLSGAKRKINALSLSDYVQLLFEIDKGMKKKIDIAAEFGITFIIFLIFHNLSFLYLDFLWILQI